jgi:ABC-type glycerol-3-phosphate transport system permease component
MTIGTNTTRVGQATEPGSLIDDAALTQQADRFDERGPGEGKPLDYQPGEAPKGKGISKQILLHTALTTIAVLLSLPFVWMLATSLKTVSEVASANWLPDTPQWINYVNVFNVNNPDINERGIPFATFFRNSIFVACWVTFLQVVTSSMAAFSFARLKWPGRDKVFLLYLSTMMLPGLVMMIPNYQIMIQLGLVDTLPGLIIPAAFSAFGTFLLRQFMLTIPASLDEAAEIDGASKFRVFWDVILPLSRPGLVTLTIFTFMGNYNSFFWPLVMLRTEERYTLPVGLLFFDSSRGQQTHLMMAAVTMSVVPMILVFILLQKQLVKGIQLGAVKG